MANEAIRVRSWITSRILADNATTVIIGDRVFSGVAPSGVGAVYVVYKFVSGSGIYALGNRRTKAGLLYDIVGWGRQNDLAKIKSVADRIDELFSYAVNVQWQGWNFSAQQEDLIDTSENDDANEHTWVRIGGTYRISTWKLGVGIG